MHMMTSNSSVTDQEGPQLLAFVCGIDSQICSPASMQGACGMLAEGVRLLDTVTAEDERDLTELWREMTSTGFSIHADVAVTLHSNRPPVAMLLHAMPLHCGADEGRFLVTLCSGFRPVSSGPDEVARCRAVLNTAVDSIITINDRCQICSVNPATEKMFGHTAEELRGNNISMLMPEPYRSQHDQYVSSYLATREASIIGVGRHVTGLAHESRNALQ